MAIAIAQLNGINLPVQFSYKVYMPKKRNSITPTANAVVTQAASPTQFVNGDEFISWTIPAATPAEFQTLFDLYNTTSPTLYTFLGYWGENFSVYFTKYSMPQVRSRFFSLSGAFQVIIVNTSYVGVNCKTGL